MEYKLSKYIYITDCFLDEEQEYKLVYSSRTGQIITLKSSTIQELQAGNFYNLQEEIIGKLIFSQILVPQKEKELNTILEEFELANKDNNTLGIVITPSANCQLGCSYCGQEHSKINITQGLSKQIIDHIKNKLNIKKYSFLNITWYGAEPLMGINSVRTLTDELLLICKEQSMTYQASMITNGLNLNIKNFQDLVVNMKVKNFQITIDGTREIHDNSRYTKQKKPTFDIIMKNIERAVKHEIYDKEKVNINIRINVHKSNYLYVNDLLDYFHHLTIQDKISITFAPVHDWGNNKADESIGISLEQFSIWEIDWFLKMKELNFKKYNLIPERIFNTCMTTTDDSVLIDARGDVSYCWEVPYTPDFENDQGFVIGNVREEKLYLKNTQNQPLRNWYDDIRNKKHNSENCFSCNFLPVCGGQCPISWYKGVQACPSFKKNIEDRMMLSYLEDNSKVTN